MLLVVSPNLAVDRILEVDRFRIGDVQRSRSVFSQPGGKGSNVARVFRQLGGDVVLTGFVGERNGSWIVDPLNAIGVKVEAIEAYPGESRTCTIICDYESRSHPTVINEETPQIDAGAAEALLDRIDRYLPDARAVVVTGSLSRGLPTDFYRVVLQRAHGHKVFALLDATGSALQEGLHGMPMILKSNLHEVASAVGELGIQPREIADALLARRDLPAHTVVTLGEVGAILVHGSNAWFASPPRVSHANPIGAGDAFAAGYVKACLDGETPPDSLRFATAVAASDAATIQPGSIISVEIPTLVSATSVSEW